MLKKLFSSFINKKKKSSDEKISKELSEQQISELLSTIDLSVPIKLSGNEGEEAGLSTSMNLGAAYNNVKRYREEKRVDILSEWRVLSHHAGRRKRPCGDCKGRNGEIRELYVWKLVGLPKSGFSFCNADCTCEIVNVGEFHWAAKGNPYVWYSPEYEGRTIGERPKTRKDRGK
jgi:hypothetical protein